MLQIYTLILFLQYFCLQNHTKTTKTTIFIHYTQKECCSNEKHKATLLLCIGQKPSVIYLIVLIQDWISWSTSSEIVSSIAP